MIWSKEETMGYYTRFELEVTGVTPEASGAKIPPAAPAAMSVEWEDLI